MSELILRHGLWLAICDGQKAMLLENRGDQIFPKLEARHVSEQKNPLSHEQGTARPGRAFSSAGRRSATEENDLHRQRAVSFLKEFATVINREVADGRIKQLVVIAPASALGQIRPFFSRQVAKALMDELARDYVKKPLHEIERALAKS
ncbi:MAG: host attachment protein [Alphaproteobacteria bacterium]|nr:host attachment protein [Alphaproteobacteria bacterium]